jgi:hypothetical protein
MVSWAGSAAWRLILSTVLAPEAGRSRKLHARAARREEEKDGHGRRWEGRDPRQSGEPCDAVLPRCEYTCTRPLPGRRRPLTPGGGQHSGAPSSSPGFPRVPQAPLTDIEEHPARGIWEQIREADAAGIGARKAQQQLWSARRFPAGHPIGELGLPFSSSRALAGIDAPMFWARQAHAEGWNFRELQQRLQRDGSAKRIKARPCRCAKANCSRPKELPGEGVTLEFGSTDQIWACGLDCAIDCLEERRAAKAA